MAARLELPPRLQDRPERLQMSYAPAEVGLMPRPKYRSSHAGCSAVTYRQISELLNQGLRWSKVSAPRGNT